MQNLVPQVLTAEPNPGREGTIEIMFKVTLADPAGHGILNMFANPAFCVAADRSTRHFIHEARSAQHAWFSRVRKILHSSGRVKRELKKMTPIIRQLSHTGVMVLDGKHVLPNQWPDRIGQQKLRNVTGHRFGRLVVIDMLPGGSCRCLCDCKCETIVRRHHLLSRKTKSCGCLKAELEARQKERKRRRAWLHTGELS
jgi:hypothetical protein